MKVFDSSDVRNVALIGHGHSGKTALTSALLYTAGATDRYLSVDDGNAVTDFDEEEVARKLSITSAVAAIPWQKTKFNLIDTPGYNIFLNDTRSAMLAADNVIDLVRRVRVLLMQQTILTAVRRPFRDEAAKRVVDVTGQARGGAEPVLWPG